MKSASFILTCIVVAALAFAGLRLVHNDYLFVAGYTVLQFVVLATAWNILGGYCGYVNFGSAAFFALGAYTTVFFYKAYPLPIPFLIVIAAIVSGVAGFGMGYLTLRLRGAFFSIATLALAVVLQTLVVNWDYVGGSRGAYIIRPANSVDFAGVTLSYVQYLFLLMLVLTVLAIVAARTIERSRLGFGFATIRDDELAAEASGVPTLRLKLIATTLSGALMGMAGAPFPYFIGYLAAILGVRARICGQLDRHADDRRNRKLGRPTGRRAAARHRSAGRDRDDLVGGEPADRRRAAGRVRDHRAERAGRLRHASLPPEGAVMTAPLLRIDQVGKRFGGFVALDGINLEVAPGERLGLIGPNGSGKSTLVNCICGTLRNETGSVTFDGTQGRRHGGAPAHRARARALVPAAAPVP